jgi:hypothetical protein
MNNNKIVMPRLWYSPKKRNDLHHTKLGMTKKADPEAMIAGIDS